MRALFIPLARAGLGLLNALVPKQDKVVLSGFPDGEDSILELTRVIAGRGDMRTVLLLECPQSAGQNLGDRVVRCSRASLSGLWHFLTAKYVFFTHGLYLSPTPPRSQTCVNVWHGMPFKRIGHMIGRTPPHSSRVIASSSFFARIAAEAFGKPETEVLVTGIPRNDVMVRASRRATEIKQAMGLADAGNPPRLIVWLPTFRQGVKGITRNDGRLHDSLFGMDDMNFEALAALLRKHHCVCVAKPHPMAAEYADVLESPEIRVWREADFAARGLSLYEVVGAADLLITDASSVYVDYLILDRPIIISFPDIEEYKATRGFSMEPVEDYLAGPIVRSFDELATAVEECLVRDDHAARRAHIAALFHDARDDQATARLIRAVLPGEAAGNA